VKVAIIDALFDGQQHPLADAVTAWVASSRRFAAFATDNATKIRKSCGSPGMPRVLAIWSWNLRLRTCSCGRRQSG